MKCTYCGYPESKVLDSRPTEEGTVIRRRRECIKCQRRFTTYEKVETMPLMVIKRDGRRQLFDIEKVRSGIIKACEKCKVSANDIDKLVQDIERRASDSPEHEISSIDLGEMIMKGLLDLDPVAYIRFASVYRELNDLNKLMDEMNKLLGKEKHE
mgnify:CR=1 FL=1